MDEGPARGVLDAQATRNGEPHPRLRPLACHDGREPLPPDEASPDMDELLAGCQRAIGYAFANPHLLEVALTHSSLRTPDRECNERLEFLGDSVLGLVVTEELYRLLPDQAEGELTRLKSAVVSRGSLFHASLRLGLAGFADFARGVGRHDELPVSVTANLVEAVIGAIYLDSGYFPAREFILRHLGKELEETLGDRGGKNFKSLLQHQVQEVWQLTPTYRTLEEGGPDHRKQFTVAAVLRGAEWGRASAGTKKEAEQEAARLALEAFERRGRGRRRRRSGRDDDGEEVPHGVGPAVARELAPSREESSLEVAERGPARLIAPEPDVDPWDGPEAGALHEVPSAVPEPVLAAPSQRPAPRPDVRAPVRAAPRPPAADDAFTAGLSIASGAPDAQESALPAAPVVAAAPARRRAPSAWTPPSDEGGFGGGL